MIWSIVFFTFWWTIGVECELMADSSPCSDMLADISVFNRDDNSNYRHLIKVNNPAYSHHKPGFVVLPESIADVQRALSCAMEHSVPFTVKCGGHSAIGASTINATGFVINLSQMNGVEILSDGVSVKVQAGAVWEDIYSVVKPTDYLVVGGLCPTVGVSGFTLGGGMSLLSRKYGLAIDNLLSLTMVTANVSDVVTVNDTSNPDLFWALRGGGGGNFGVVVDFTYQLQPGFDGYTYGEMIFPLSEDSDNRSQAMTIMGSTTDFPSTDIIFDTSLAGNQEFQIRYFHFGSKVEDSTDELISALDTLSSSHMVKSFSTYWELRDYHISRIIYNQIEEHPFLPSSCMLRGITDEVARALLHTAGPIPESCVHIFVHIGGKAAAYQDTDTAYPHRKALFELYSLCYYENRKEEQDSYTYLKKLYGSLQDYCVGSYVNDAQLHLRDWQHKYYGNNYERLVSVQEKWNPLDKGTYHFLQSIGSEYEPEVFEYNDDNDDDITTQHSEL